MKLTWDAEAGVYRRPGGRALTATEVRQALDRDALILANYASDLAEQLRTGEISLDEWHSSMRDLIKQTHVSAAALAVGGRENATPADWGRTGRIIQDEYKHLDNWTQDILSGEAPLDGRVRPRASQYAQAARFTYHEIERRRQEDAGFDQERSVLHPAEHCDDCLEQASAGEDGDGWVPIGLMTPIGARQCHRYCKCSVEYRATGQGTAQATLVLTEEEQARKLADIERRIAEQMRQSGRASPGLLAARTRILQAQRPGGPAPPTSRFTPEDQAKLDELNRKISEQQQLGGKASPGLLAARTRLLKREINLPTAAPRPKVVRDLSQPPKTLAEMEERFLEAGVKQISYNPPFDRGTRLLGGGSTDEPTWGIPLSGPEERLAIGSAHLREVERLRELYPDMVPIDRVYIAESRGGRAHLPSQYPGPISTVFSSELNSEVATLAQYRLSTQLRGMEWTVGMNRGDWRPGTVRHEVAHTQTTFLAEAAWRRVRRTLKAEGIDFDELVTAGTRQKQAKRFQTMVSEYGGSNDIWEEIAETGSMVSAPWYERGTLPRVMEEYVDRLYNGANFDGFLTGD